MSQSEEARGELTLKSMKAYDKASESYFDLCLNNKDWLLVQVA